MKRKGNRVLLLGAALAVVLTACAAPVEQTPAPQESESTTTTAMTTAEVETTSSTADTTETTTTTTTAKPTASITTKSTTKKTTKATATTEEFDPYAPYEDNSLVPDKDKQRLLFHADGGEIELVFEKAMRYPADNNAVLWHYTGTTKKGTPMTCTVAPEQNAIREIAYDVNTDFGPMTYEKDARACLERFLKAYDIPYKADNAQISHSMAAKRGENGTVFHINWRFSLPLKENDGILGGKIGLINGKLVVHSLYASSVLEGERVFGYSGDDIPLLIPRWKSE